MIMLDVRNALANILDKYTLQDSVNVTLHKMKKDKVPLPFLMKMIGSASHPFREPGPAGKAARAGKPRRKAAAGKPAV
jgi:hypothetical protein